MTNALAIYERMNELQVAARAMQSSGFFADVKSEAQALVKVMAGAEIGLPPFAAMTGIHIVQGKPVIGANLIATMVKNSGRYDYRVARADNAACILEWHENGQRVGQSSFSIDEAQAAGLAGKDNWKKYPSDMLFARALTRGARRYAPGIFGGAPIYTPDELGVDTDEDGAIIPGEVVNVTPAQATASSPAQATPPDDGPLADDELTIKEAPAADFVNVAAALLEVDAAAVKDRLHALGYERVPGKPAERVAAYRKLRDYEGEATPAALPLDDPDATQAAKDTAAGLFD